MTGIRKIIPGDLILRASVQNRMMEDVLTGSGYLADGSDFAGFGTVAALAAEATARSAADALLLGVYVVQSGEVGVTSTQYPVGDVRRYGAVLDNSTDDAPAFRAAVNAVVALGRGGEATAPAGNARLAGNPFLNQVSATLSGGQSVSLRLAGTALKMDRQLAIPANCIVKGNGRLASAVFARSGFIPTVGVASISLVSLIATVTTSSAHQLEAGASVILEGCSNTSFNGGWQVTTVPSSTTFTFAITLANTTSTGGLATIPLVALGTATGTGVAVGCRIENLWVNAQAQVGSVGIYSNLINEQAGCVNVLCTDAYRRGVWIEKHGSTGNLVGPINYTLRDMEVFPTPNVSATGIYIRGTLSQHRGVENITIAPSGGVSGNVAVGLDISGAPGLYSRIHIEACTDGILVGARGGVASGIDSSAVTIAGLTGHSTVTNLVRLVNAGETRNIVLMGLVKLLGTNILVDEQAGITLTEDNLAFYATSGGSTPTRMSTSPNVPWSIPKGTALFDQRVTVRLAASAAEGAVLDQTLAGAASARLFLANSTDGTGVSICAQGNSFQFSTGAVPGSATGTARAFLQTDRLNLTAGVGLQVGGGTLIKAQQSTIAVWDPPSLAAGTQTTTTVTCTGAVVGDVVAVGFTKDLQGMQLTGYVSAADTVTVVLRNGTAGALDLASGTLRASVWQY